MINDYFTDRITICNPSTDEWDRVTWVYTEYDCRLERYERTIQFNGESTGASWKIFMNYDVDVRPDSRIYLGTGLNNSQSGSGSGSEASPLPDETFLVLQRKYMKDFDAHHVEVIL